MTGPIKYDFKSKSEAAMFSDPTSLQYLTGAHFTAGTALVGPAHRALFVDGRYFSKARRMLGKSWEVIRAPARLGELIGRIKSLGILGLLVDTESISAARYKKLIAASDGLRISEAEGLADRIRAVKRPAELKIIRDAVRLTDEIWTRVRRQIRLGMTEKDLLADIKQEAHRLGAEGMSFEPIVVSGPSTAEPHAEAGDKKITGDEPLLVDMGVRLGGYCSDFTRTPFLMRKRTSPPAWFVSFQKEVLAIQNLAYGLIARGVREPGVISKKISLRLEQKRLRKFYLHGLGHGVGMKIHEEPYLTETGRTLKDGMVFTVEPGLYRAGVGGVRIEDMACLWRGRLEVLTQSSKETAWRL